MGPYEETWPQGRVREAALRLSAGGLAILGGEALLVRDGATIGVLPAAGGALPLVYSWETVRRPGEPWEAYCVRGAAEAAEAAQAVPAGEIAPEWLPFLRFCLVTCTEDEYARLE